MSAATPLGLSLAGSAVGLALGLVAWHRSYAAWKSQRRRVDFAMAVTASVWILHLLAGSSFAIAADSFPAVRTPAAYVTHLICQALLVCAGFLLLSFAGISNAATHFLLLVQAVAGMVALHGLDVTQSAAIPAYQSWVSVNLLSIAALTVAISWHVYRIRSYPGWLALAGSVLGLGLGIDDWFLLNQARQAPALLYYFYAAFLIVVWHLVSQRASPWTQDASEWPNDQSQSEGTSRATASAVAYERRRIARDLHDGVGSQIIHILSTLDSHAPQQRTLALALEQCLLDLKITVDAIDQTNDSVTDALGRLRYRVQHSLDKLDIHMNWQVEVGEALESVRGECAQQVLRITQESLANVMRHAQASSVEVVCRVLSGNTHLVLEVRDNGQGITTRPVERPAGKGLENMRQRAQQLQGELLIFTKPGMGTRVQLIFPLSKNKPPTAR